jgi:hypothetical protein
MTSSSAHQQQPAGVNPFARALAEARGGMTSDQSSKNLMDSLQGSSDNSPNAQTFDVGQEQKRLQEQQKYDKMRADLHRKVNPVEQRDVFNARKEQIKQEINSIRQELKLLSQEISSFKQEIDQTLLSNVGDPGEDGKYYLTFYQKLREFITLLRKKVHSARTWAHTFQGKKSRQAGLNFGQKGHKQTKTVWDSMHHERSLARAGG